MTALVLVANECSGELYRVRKTHALVLATGWTDEEGGFLLSKYATKVDFMLNRTPPSTSFIKNSISCLFQTFSALPMIKGYDVLLSMATMNGLTYASICRFVRQVRVPHVTIDIGTPRFVGRSAFRRSLMKFFLSTVDRVICPVSSKTAFWSQYMGFPNKGIFIPEGVNPDLYTPNFQSEGDYVISVGRAARDYETLFSAVRGLDVKLIAIMGADPIQNKAESELFHSRIVNPFPNIKIMREVPPPLTRKLIANSRFVMLSLLDIPFSSGGIRVLLESMATGKAVVATRVHHTIDYIEDFKTGIFSEPNNPKDLRDKALYLLKHPGEAERIGRNARRAIEEKFNERRMARDVEDVLIDVVNDRGGAR